MPVEILMPALSPTMTDGTLAKWLKAEGDTVEAGDVIAEIETDKATMEVEAIDEGTIGKILVAEGSENVPVNNAIALLLEDDEDASALEGYTLKGLGAAAAAAPVEAADSVPVVQSSAPVAEASSSADRVFASPLARRIANNKNISLKSVKGTGPRGRIVKRDVENFQPDVVAAPVGAPSSALPAGAKVNMFGMAYTEIPNNNIKKITAKRLTESKSEIPHFYLSMDIELDNLLSSRKALNEQANGAFKLSVNDFVVKACAMALKAYPDANVSWNDDAVHQYLTSDISVAVATPNGLITPIVRNAETKGLAQISAEVKELAGKAREGKLKPAEFQGGSFSLSNLGMFGVKNFQAILNPPQACILAVGAGEQRPVVRNGQIEIATVMTATLSVDHRAVDGAIGAEYLKVFKQYIENPVAMLV